MKREVRLAPYLVGGGQESGFRAGTEPVPQIAAFAAACRVRAAQMEADIAHTAALQAYLRQQVELICRGLSGTEHRIFRRLRTCLCRAARVRSCCGCWNPEMFLYPQARHVQRAKKAMCCVPWGWIKHESTARCGYPLRHIIPIQILMRCLQDCRQVRTC